MLCLLKDWTSAGNFLLVIPAGMVRILIKGILSFLTLAASTEKEEQFSLLVLRLTSASVDLSERRMEKTITSLRGTSYR